MIFYQLPYRAKGYPFLLHTIPVPDGYGTIFLCLVIDGHAKRRANGIHSPVASTDSILFLVKAFERIFTFIHQATRNFWQPVFLLITAIWPVLLGPAWPES